VKIIVYPEFVNHEFTRIITNQTRCRAGRGDWLRKLSRVDPNHPLSLPGLSCRG